jgi:hypothetical protein
MNIWNWLVARKRGAAVVGISIMVAIGAYVGSSSYVPGHRPSSGANTLLWLYAPRDMGRLPSRASWCTGAAHCWMAQETAGATQLHDETGDATLTAVGTPRAGVFTGLPVEDATGWVDFTSELAVHTDGQSATTGYYLGPAQTQSATNLVSVVAIIMPTYRQATTRILYQHNEDDHGHGIEVGIDTGGLLYATAYGNSATKTVKTAAAWDDGAWRCVTFLIDARTDNAGKIYIGSDDVTGAAKDFKAAGDFSSGSHEIVLGSDEHDDHDWPGGIARLKVVNGVTTPATDCGTLWQAVKPNAWNKLASAADSAWTQTGGARCFPSSATTALCTPGGKAAPTWDSALSRGGMAWGLGINRTQLQIWNSHVCVTTGFWTLRGTATAVCASDISPSGAKTASVLTVGATGVNDVLKSASGFTAGDVLKPAIWVKCSSGTLNFWNFYSPATQGKWSVNCSTVGGSWALIKSGHPALTETVTWTLSGTSAGLNIHAASGTVTASVWLPSLTAAAGDSVIVTRGAAVSTGTIAWTIDNDPAVYYKGAKGKMTITGDWLSGGCVDTWNGATNVGRFGGDGTHWMTYNSDATAIAQANLTQSGVDTLLLRWDSTAAIAGGIYEVLTRDGAAATWDTTPISAWTSATPTPINLDGYGTTSCRASLQELKIEDRP